MKAQARQWQWMLTFRVVRPSNRGMVKHFMRELAKIEKIQVAYIETFSPLEMVVHLVAIGDSKTGRTLDDVEKRRWERRWTEVMNFSSGGLDIRDCHDPTGAFRYVTDKHHREDSRAETTFYNRKLIKKHQLMKGANQ